MIRRLGIRDGDNSHGDRESNGFPRRRGNTSQAETKPYFFLAAPADGGSVNASVMPVQEPRPLGSLLHPR